MARRIPWWWIPRWRLSRRLASRRFPLRRLPPLWRLSLRPLPSLPSPPLLLRRLLPLLRLLSPPVLPDHLLRTAARLPLASLVLSPLLVRCARKCMRRPRAPFFVFVIASEAKQSMSSQRKPGLLNRCAPRNDDQTQSLNFQDFSLIFHGVRL